MCCRVSKATRKSKVSMVCAPGRGRMAAMERLLATGNFPEMSAEEASREKLAAKTIHKEMHEADEANLLEEEDMHVFDCKPLTDPLHLVSCNACKKPIKASQYAAHAERCRSLNSSEDAGLDLDGGNGHKKPPRKGRKKVQTSQDNQAATAGEQERSESFDGDDTAASESANMYDNQIGMASSLSRDIKNGGIVMDGSGVSLGSTNFSAGAMSPSKRAKLKLGEAMVISDGVETAYGVTAEVGICCQGILICGVHSESCKQLVTGRKQHYDMAVGHQKPRQSFEGVPGTKGDHLKKDAPVPLATKLYRSQRNHRLRAALGFIYRETVAKEHSNDSSSPKLIKGSTMTFSQVPSPNNLLHETHKDGMIQKKKDAYGLPTTRNPDQLLAQSSEMCLGASGGYPSSMNFSNQFRDSNFARPALSVDAATTTPMGMMRTRYLTAPYSFPGNPGTNIGTMQQPNGIVPVI